MNQDTPCEQAQPSAPSGSAIVDAFLRVVPDLLFRMNRQGVYLDYLARDSSKLIVPPEEFLGRCVTEVLPADLAARCQAAISLTLRTGQLQTYEYRLERESGPCWYEVRMTPCAPDEVLLIVREVTDQRRAERALRKSEQTLALHFEQASLGVIEWGLDFTVRQWNAGAERIFGFTKQQAIGRDGTALLVHETARPHVEGIWKALVDGNGGTRSTNENITADGRRIVCEWSNTPLVDEAGSVIGIASVVDDVTERVRAQNQLLYSRENYESLVNSIDGVVWEADPETLAFSFVSRQAERILGCPPDAWVRDCAAWQRLIHPEDLSRVLAHRRAIVGSPSEQRIEYRMVRPGAGCVWVRDSITVVADRERTLKLRGIMVDITDRKRAEAAHLESEARFRRVTDSNLIGIYFWDTSGHVLEANDAFLRMLGYSRDDLESGRIDWRAATPPEFRFFADRALEQMRHFGASKPYAKEFCRKDGSRLPVLIGDAFLENSTERGVGFVLDMAERRLAEDRQALMVKELDHRVRNNMAAVLTLTEQSLRAASSTSLPPREAVENLLARLRAMARTHNVLARTHWSGASLRPLVRQTLDAFRHGDPLAFSIEGEDVVLPPRIATVMTMALHELATNALKYGALSSPEGRISVRWQVTRQETAGSRLNLVWHEAGGPPVAPPTRRGFGLELIEGGVSYESHGRAELEFNPSGLRCSISIGLDDPDPCPTPDVVVKVGGSSVVNPLSR